MNITIGEIIEIILPFTTSMNVIMHGRFPCVNASIGNICAMTRLFISIMQTSEHMYAMAITDDVYNGNKIIPTENSGTPFIREKNFLNRTSDDLLCIKDIPYGQFKTRFLRILYSNDLIKFDPINLKKRLIDLGFNSMKIKRVIGKSFKSIKCSRKDIGDLIQAVNINNNKFDLTELEEKELRCVYAKLKSIGLETTIVDKYIVRIDYERG